MHILNSAALGAAKPPTPPTPPAPAAAPSSPSPTPASSSSASALPPAKMARLPRIGGMDTHLLESLVYEAEQCARAMDDLARLRRSLAPSQRDELLLTRERVGVCRSSLLALADSFPLHAAQVFRILNHVDAALQCLGRTLRDVHGWCADLSLSREERWRMMARAMLVEGKGRMTLEKRFRLYAKFFECLDLALCGSPVFDKFKAETLRLEIMDLRKARRIKLPKNPTTTFYPFEDPNPSLPPSRYLHWSEDILASPMPSSTLFEVEGRSESYGPFQAWDDLNIESYSQLLFRKTIKKDEMSLSLFLNPYDQRFHLLLRCNYKGRPYFSCRPVQDLHVTRSGGSGTTLHLSRWSVSQRGYKYWAVVHLGTYEELIVLYCTILSLKFRANTPIAPTADELLFTGEVRLWKAYILDNGFKHKLSLYEDKLTGARRLHAVPADGQLARCPAWTIFLTNHVAGSQGRVLRTASNKVVALDAILYIFGQEYRPHLNKRPRFDIIFYGSNDCMSFLRWF